MFLGGQITSKADAEGAIITNTIAGAYTPTHVTGNQVKPVSGSKPSYYSHDFVLPSRDIDSDYDNAEDKTTHKGSSLTSSTLGTATSAKAFYSPSTVEISSHIPVTPSFGHHFTSSVTAIPSVIIPISPVKKYSFPGPSGSINDYKPAPPGGGGPDKAWLVTSAPTSSHTAAQSASIASSQAGTVGLTQSLISSFPGSVGSIYDSKPVSGVNPSSGSPHSPSKGCSGIACSSQLPSHSIGNGCNGASCSTGTYHKPSHPGLGCASGSFCGTAGGSPGSGINSVIGLFPGSTGSIYDSKPISSSATGCSNAGCTGQTPSSPVKPIWQNPSNPNVGVNHPTLPGNSGSIHDYKPISGTTNTFAGSGSQNTAGASQVTFQPSVTGSTHPLFPGYPESKPAGGLQPTLQPVIGVPQSTPIPVTPISLPGPTAGLHESKPVSSSQGSSSINPALTNIIGILPGHPGSIYDSKPVSTVSGGQTNTNSNANANAGASVSSAPCTGSSCTYPSSSVSKPPITSTGCSGIACSTRPTYSLNPFIPVKIVPDYKPTFGVNGCTGSACGNKVIGNECTGTTCGGHNSLNTIPITVLVPPEKSFIPSQTSGCTGASCSITPQGSSGCTGTSCSGNNITPQGSGCDGQSCSGGVLPIGQVGFSGSSATSNTQTSTGSDSGNFWFIVLFDFNFLY